MARTVAATVPATPWPTGIRSAGSGGVPRQVVESTIGELRVRAARAWFIMDWKVLRRRAVLPEPPCEARGIAPCLVTADRRSASPGLYANVSSTHPTPSAGSASNSSPRHSSPRHSRRHPSGRLSSPLPIHDPDRPGRRPPNPRGRPWPNLTPSRPSLHRPRPPDPRLRPRPLRLRSRRPVHRLRPLPRRLGRSPRPRRRRLLRRLPPRHRLLRGLPPRRSLLRRLRPRRRPGLLLRRPRRRLPHLHPSGRPGPPGPPRRGRTAAAT
jgi:hypothetical protein